MSLYGRIFPIEQLPKDMPSLEALVDSLPFGFNEKNRLHSIRNEAALRQSLAAWLSLRDLSEFLSLRTPLTVLRTDLGKPYFPEPTFPNFNLSHTQTVSVAVVNTERDVGVDVESLQKIRINKDLEKIAHRFFSESEQKLLKNTDTPNDLFLQIWTKKEALAKLTGEGLVSVIGKNSILPKPEIQSFRLQIDSDVAYLTVATNQVSEPIQWIGLTDSIQIREI